ncbi:YgiQ family radical SAM protein [Elusimicrobiota bacterium]
MNTLCDFIPTTIKEAEAQGISAFDVIIVSADAYVDHPAFAAAVIGRYLQGLGLEVGIISQPDWKSIKDFTALGKPRLFFGVTAGNLDSMVSLYTAQRKIRSGDPYTENGIGGRRPYLPTVVYTNRLKEAFKGVPVIIGGIEVSLRRIAHYDYYTDKVKSSILLDSKADMLVYGNGEAPLKEIISRYRSGASLDQMRDIRGTALIIKGSQKAVLPGKIQHLPPYEQVKNDKSAFNLMTSVLFSNLNPYSAQPLYQEAGTRGVLINPPAFPLNTAELDDVYAFPFKRQAHPRYKGKIPALDMIRHSITSHRGCYGGCSFCSLYMHQGKIVQSRSAESIKNEIMDMAAADNRKIIITDVGGPTANMYGTFCKDKKFEKKCKRKSCLYPLVCRNLNTSHKDYRLLLKKIRKLPCVKKAYINSGIRCDLALLDKQFIKEAVMYYTQGQLSIAPEHCSPEVLKIMNKPDIKIYEEFIKLFQREKNKAKKKHLLAPYFIVAHPGADADTEADLKKYMHRNRVSVKQLQEFYPTPMTIATAIYYTGMDPETGRNIRVERRPGIKKKWKRI